MNVDGVEPSRIYPSVRFDAVQSQSRPRPDGPSEQARHDRLALSDRARELRSALKAVQAAPDVREDRIAALQREIAAGTYHIPAEKLARAILRGG